MSEPDGLTVLAGVPPLVIEPDGAQLERYIASRARVKFIQGPVGSGKSTGSWHALMVNAFMRQVPANGAGGSQKGVRYRRTLVLRNTLKQIKDTVLPTKRLVMPEHIWGATTTSGRPRHHIRMPGVDWEILFYGLDDPVVALEDLKSLEISDAYASEVRYLPREILVAAAERTGRYPPVAWGGCTEPQLMGDTNAPEVGSWLSVISGQSPMPEGLSADDRMAYQMPKGWDYILQPPAVLEVRDAAGDVTGYKPNPGAENQKFLSPSYYADKIDGKTRSEIETELGNRPGSRKAGKPVWPNFRQETHATTGLTAVKGHMLLAGMDFGRTPCAIIGQQVFGGWRILREIITDSMGARDFARLFKAKMAEWFPDNDFAAWGDPAGENMEQSDDVSPFLSLRAEGLRVVPAPTNDWGVRRDAVGELFLRMADGRPGFLIDSAWCPVLTAALAGQYAYPRMQGGGERYADRPLKNRFSHPADALQYLVLGGGEGRALVQKTGAVATARAAGLGGMTRPPPARIGGRGWAGLDRRGRR